MGKINKLKTITVKSIGFILASGLCSATNTPPLGTSDNVSSRPETRRALLDMSNLHSSAPDADRDSGATGANGSLVEPPQITTPFSLKELCDALCGTNPVQVEELVTILLHVTGFTPVRDEQIRALISMQAINWTLPEQGADFFYMDMGERGVRAVLCRKEGRFVSIMREWGGFRLATNLGPQIFRVLLGPANADSVPTSFNTTEVERMEPGFWRSNSNAQVDFKGLRNGMRSYCVVCFTSEEYTQYLARFNPAPVLIFST